MASSERELFLAAINVLTPKGAEREYVSIQTNLNEGSLGVSVKFHYNVKEQEHVDRWIKEGQRRNVIINVDIRDLGEDKNYWGETHHYCEIEYTLRLDK